MLQFIINFSKRFKNIFVRQIFGRVRRAPLNSWKGAIWVYFIDWLIDNSFNILSNSNVTPNDNFSFESDLDSNS